MIPKKYAEVKGLQMAYVEAGQGGAQSIVFLHGNPTSSYLWRNIIPQVADLGRCIAPDLIGMGDSDKLPNAGPESYTFAEHREYLDGLLDQLNLGNQVVLVIHDWGSALGFDWARRHQPRVKGVCYMEAIVRPLRWDEWSDAARSVFQGFRSPAGEQMALEKNIFVERVLPGSIQRQLSDEEMTEYRRPFLNPGEDRRPTLTWPRQIPLDGEPEDVVQIVEAYARFFSASDMPKLLISAEPGAILIGEQLAFCRAWRNQTEVKVSGSHFIQEDSADEIGSALRTWLQNIG